MNSMKIGRKDTSKVANSNNALTVNGLAAVCGLLTLHVSSFRIVALYNAQFRRGNASSSASECPMAARAVAARIIGLGTWSYA